jgi:hypothetical protein
MNAVEPTLVVRVTRSEGVGLIRLWSAAEGWNPEAHVGPC